MTHFETPRLRWRGAEAAAMVAVLLLAASLRLARLEANPAWYTDEGTHLDIARHMRQGQIQYLAINQSLLLFGRLPLFDGLLAAAGTFAGDGMFGLRLITALLGTISVGLLYAVVRAARPAPLALLSAALLAVYPQAVLYSRFGFSYNLLAPLVLLAGLGLVKYHLTSRRRWLALACLAMGIGCFSDLWMFAIGLPVAVVILARRWRDALWGLPLIVLPFGGYAAVMLARAPEAFWFDWGYTLTRLDAIPPAQQFSTLVENCMALLAEDRWIAAAIPGLILLRPAALRRVSLLLFGLPIATLGRTVALYSLSYYYMIPLLPLVALGAAALIDFAVAGLWRLTARPTRRWPGAAARGIGLLIVAAPLAISAATSFGQVQSGFVTPIDIFLIQPEDARAAAAFVNARTAPEDVIIASPAVAWLVQGKAADFQMALAALGVSTAHLPAGIPASRFGFDPRPARARFVIVDNLWINWGAVHMAGVAALVRGVAGWPLVFQSGEVRVFRNPNP